MGTSLNTNFDPSAAGLDENGAPISRNLTASGMANLGPLPQPNAEAPHGSYWGDMGRVGGAITRAAGNVLRTVTSADWAPTAPQPGAISREAQGEAPPVTVAASTMDPRSTGGAGRGMQDRGTDTPNPALTNPATRGSGVGPGSSMPSPMIGDAQSQGMTTEQSNAYYGAQRLAGEAADKQNLQQRSDRAAEAAARPNSRDIDRLQGEARVANFQATNGQISGNQFGPNFTAGKEALMGRANIANAALGNAQKESMMPSGVPGANFVQQAQEKQAAGEKAVEGQANIARSAQGLQTGALGQQEMQQKLAAGKMQLGLQSHLTDLQQRASSGDPEAQASLNSYRQIEKGEGGALTQQQIGKMYADYAGHLAITGQTPDPALFIHGIMSMVQASKGGATPPPTVGEVRGGYRFKGGDPSQQASYEKV